MVTQDELTKIRELLDPLENWHHDCHSASNMIVQAQPFTCRVARGFCDGVGSQHSWVVVGKDCFDINAEIIDPTLWSYDSEIEGIYLSSNMNGRYRPHGQGSIWEWGRPVAGDGEPIELEATKPPWSEDACAFLDALGPLDREGWARLTQAPVEEWPAAEILAGINKTVGPLVPIDIIGMITTENPGGVYLPVGREAEFEPERD